MVNKILTAAGIPYRRGRFTSPVKGCSYIVYMDDTATDGPDDKPTGLIWHDITVELYEFKPDDAAEAALEAAIAASGLQYTKQDRYWLQTEQMYQLIYEFRYKEKRRT